MSGLGTDVMALACILGGAAVSGAVSLAALGGGAHDHDMSCAVETLEVPGVVVSAGGEARTIVVAPRVRMHAEHGCEAVVVNERVRLHLERAEQRMERAQERMERAQERVQRAQFRLQRMDQAELEKARRMLEERQAELASLGIETAGLEAALAGLGEGFEAEVQARLEKEMQELAKRMERLDDEIGR